MFRHILQKCILDKSLLQILSSSKCVTRGSVYSSSHLPATYHREDLDKPLSEDDPRRFQPIKAALNEQGISHNHDELVNKFIRLLLKEGKKQLATKIMYNTFQHVKYIQLERYHRAKSDIEKESLEMDPKVIFYQAVENCKPLLVLQQVKRGGVVYQVPIPVKPNYQVFKAMKWLIESSIEKDRKLRIWVTLAKEFIDASRNEGRSVRKKQELHKICEDNRAYAHFRW